MATSRYGSILLLLVVYQLCVSPGCCRKSPRNFQLRLVDGPSEFEGRLEVSLEGMVWGSVCDDGFTPHVANVACKELGFIRSDTYYFGAYFGHGADPIMLDELLCYGNESSLWDCEHNEPAVHDCTHDEDISIKCNSMTVREKYRLETEQRRLSWQFRIFDRYDHHQPNSKGVVEVFMKGKWRTICSDGWDMDDARVICGSSGFPDALSIKPREKIFHRKKGFLLRDFQCEGTESALGECGVNEIQKYKRCQSSKAAYVICHRGTFVIDTPGLPEYLPNRHSARRPAPTPYHPILRLKAGKAFGEGRVELFHDGKWGTICSRDFKKTSGNVLCRELGFGTVQELFSDGSMGQGVGPIWLWNVGCDGTESSILECDHGRFNRSNCIHGADLGIKCNAPDLGVRDKIEAVDGRYDMEGRIIMLVDSHWGTICGEGWDIIDAMVACRQLGLGYAQAAPKSTHYLRSTTVPILITEMNCNGTEKSLQDCSYTTLANNNTCICDNEFRAGVSCIGKLPDVMLDLHVLAPSVYIQDYPEHALECAAEEGCLSDVPASHGLRRLLRFSSAIMNRGNSAFRPFLSRNDWEWHACHLHYHSMTVFAHYDITSYSGERVAEGHKASFCLEDGFCDSGTKKVFSCNGDQGISANCIDVYRNDIDCQWIDITGVSPGRYLLKVDINPELKVAETDYSNNEIICDLFYNGHIVQTRNCRYTNDE